MLARQSMTPVSNVYVLPRCDVALYQTASNGVLGSLVWSAQQVDNLRVAQHFDEAEQFSTGMPYADTHHLSERNEISFDAIWNVAAKLKRNTEYILSVTWNDANFSSASKHWVRRFYNGVTTASRDISSRDGNEFGSGNVLKAKYFAETEGSNAPVAPNPGDPTC